MSDEEIPADPIPEEALPPEGEFTDPWIGQTLAGYEIIKRVGEGGMGIVYLGKHESLRRQAAIKFLGAHMINDTAYVERFLHEARGAAKLNHPNIVQVYDAGSCGEGVYYFIMEYIAGKDLGILLREMGILGVSEAVGYVRQAAAALGYAHGQKIIHRDVKPDNLMLTAENVIKVGDLGLAKWTTDEGSGGMTQTGMVMGTPFYISPEQVRGAKDVSSRSDIYSLGSTLFHLVTGKIPYDGPSPAVIMSMHLNNPVPEPSKVNPALDRDICSIIKKMMAKKPDERYQTMDEVDEVLSEYISRSSHPTQILSKPGKVETSIAAVQPAYRAWVPPAIAQSEAGSSGKVGSLVVISTLIAAVLVGWSVMAAGRHSPVEDALPVVQPSSATPSAVVPPPAPETAPAPVIEPSPQPPAPPADAPAQTPPVSAPEQPEPPPVAAP